MPEDFNKLRTIARRLVKIPFRLSWEFRLELDDAPKEWDYYVKDMSYAPYELDTEDLKAGFQTITYPIQGQPIIIAMTMRDNEDHEIYKWIESQIQKIYNSDGTFNPPSNYLTKLRRYSLLEHGTKEEETDEIEGYFNKIGDFTESRDEPGIMEFPVNYVQFRS